MALLNVNTIGNGRRRTRYVPFITFLLCCMMISSLLIYIDSSSIYVWTRETEAGPASFVISGEAVHEYIDDFRDVPGIVSAEIIELCWCELLAYIIPPVNYTSSSHALSDTQEQQTYSMLAPYEPPPMVAPATAAYLRPSFSTSFPELYSVFAGRLPQNDSEIALAYWLAARFQVGPGSSINYTRGYTSITSNVTVVGIFRQPVTNNSLELHYIRADVIVTSGLFADKGYDSYVYADIDRSIISPQNPKGALTYLAELDERLRRVDPEFRVSKQWTIFYVDDLLANGINTYMVWLNGARFSQVIRSSGFIFLGVIVSGVGVSFYTRTKKTEAEILRVRGASPKRIIFTQYSDILLLATFSIPIGIFGGFIVSRLGLVCVSFFSFDFSNISDLPFLLSAETLVVTTLLTFIVPVLMIINQSTTERIKSSSFVAGSRLAKYSGKINNIRWELVVLFASILLLLSIIQQGGLIAQAPDYRSPLVIIPIILVLSVTSLAIKSITILTKVISKVLRHILTETPSFIGVRRIGKHVKFAGPTIVIFVLTVSLTWTAVITSYTIPSTAQGHTRFAIGGDVAFKLNTIDTSYWDEFVQNVTTHSLVKAATQVNVRILYMTSTASSATEFVSINPSQFIEVGFDSLGLPLEESPLSSYLNLLDVNPSGVVITNDLSVVYGLQVGDTLRACTINGTEFIPHPFTIIGITDSLPDSLVTDGGYNFLTTERVGIGRVWINSEYAEPLLSDEPIANSLFCVRMVDISKSEELVESIVESGGLRAIDGYGIATVYSELDETVHDSLFVIERSIDTMLVFISAISVISIFIIYSYESKKECIKQNAILKTLGADITILRTVNVAEMLGSVIVSMIVLLLVSPFFIITSIMVYLVDFGARLFLFPSPILIVTPWLALLSILGSLIIIIILISIVTVASEQSPDMLASPFRNISFELAEWRES